MSNTGEGISTSNTVTIEVVSGCEGPSLYVNGYRIAGPKPWGGGNRTHVWSVLRNRLTEDLRRVLTEGEELETRPTAADVEAAYKEGLAEASNVIVSCDDPPYEKLVSLWLSSDARAKLTPSLGGGASLYGVAKNQKEKP